MSTSAASSAQLGRQHGEQQLHDFGLHNGALHQVAPLQHDHQKGDEGVQAAGSHQVGLAPPDHKPQPGSHVSNDVVGDLGEGLSSCGRFLLG